MNLTAYLTIWVALAVVVLAMAAYRNLVAVRDDRTLHVTGHGELIPQQIRAAKLIHAVDRWGQSLTVVLILYGLVLAIVYLHGVWQRATMLH